MRPRIRSATRRLPSSWGTNFPVKWPKLGFHGLSGGLGVDVAFEMTDVPSVLHQCINSTHYEGETVIVSIWEKDAAFQPNTVVLKERTMEGIIAYRDIPLR